MDAVRDLLDECEDLRALVETVDAGGWQKSTSFHDWTVYDQIAHNHFLDLLAIRAISEPARFSDFAEKLLRASRTDPEYSIRTCANEAIGLLSRDEMLALWVATYTELGALLVARDPLEKMPWFGPPMSIESCANARQMETWAHGQDIWDMLGRLRPAADRIRNIATLGVKTFSWSFLNRQQEPPAIKPFVCLTGPSGAQWTWNDPQSPETVFGPAEDFCHVVTQRRHVDDTRLQVSGVGARRWLEIAQCFAGDPADGPRPGERALHGADSTAS